jgi:hypothetical protein
MTREAEKQRDQNRKAERQFGRVDTYAGQMQMEREQAEATRAALAIWRKAGAR